MKKMRLMTMISWIAGLALLLSACSGPIAFIQKSQHDSGSPANGLTPGSINGWVWHDACASGLDGEPAPAETPAGCVKGVSAIGGYHADGVMGVDEKPIAGVTVRLGQGACPSTGLDQAITIDTDLSYTFTGLKAGTYCVSIDPFEKANQDVLLPGIWTRPKLQEGLVGATINLASGENKMDVNFGWDHQFKPDGETSAISPSGLREISVEDVRVDIGVGSPIPVKVMIAGTWPGLCSQLAQIEQTSGENSFDIRLLATPDEPSCPPDHLGLPFGIEIPLNMVEKPAGTYTVSVNGVKTTFDWQVTAANVDPAEGRYTYEGVSFALDLAFSTGASGQLIPENPASSDGPYWEVHPEVVSISLDGYPPSQNILQPVVAVYPVADYRKLSGQASKTLDRLVDLLGRKLVDERQMPFLPEINAGQVFHSNVQYLDFQNGSGVRYLAVLAQYPAPVNNQDLFYTYQGLTADARYFVSIILPVSHPSLPASPRALSISELEAVAKDASYYGNMAAELSTLPDSSFTPDLSRLDAMVASLAIER